MKSTDAVLERLRETVPVLSERYNVKRIGVFGSYIRNEQKEAISTFLSISVRNPRSGCSGSSKWKSTCRIPWASAWISSRWRDSSPVSAEESSKSSCTCDRKERE